MEILQSNYPPVRTRSTSFFDMFYSLLAQARCLDIAVGYVTADSLIELQKLAEFNDNLAELNLTIGMHYIEHFTHAQYNAAKRFNDYLRESGRGQVRLVTAFKYHGKIYSYSNDSGAFACIIGSNNLGSIVERISRVYETSILIDDFEQAKILKEFIKQLNCKASRNIEDCDIQQFNTMSVLEDQFGVEKVSQHEVLQCLYSRTDTFFVIPIKGAEDAPKSNLNVFFGKGREGSNGLIVPRHWYEVELIVPKDIATQPGYPNAATKEAVFNVITDDCWKFSCRVSGQNNKNFRSEGDLRILGKWLKGRLEDAGVLTIGSPVLNETLKQYGRDNLTLTKTTLPNTWYLDFGVKK